MLFRTTEVKLGLVLSLMHKIVHSNITVNIFIHNFVYENVDYKANHDDDVGHYDSKNENIELTP